MTEMPVTKNNMNYVSIVSVGLTVAMLALYIFSKKGKYPGPRLPNESFAQEVYEVDEGLELDNIALEDSSKNATKND